MKNKIIKFILSFTDYDELKEENKQLKDDIKTIIEKPNSVEAYVIIESHNMKKQLSKFVWFGEMDIKLGSFDGIITHETI